jgi:hypothetical protein
MNKDNNIENLLYNLPDYVTGKLADEGLRIKITEEINSNTDFKKEYESMKEAYSSFKDLEFSEPPTHYFTNLVPLINQRIESDSKFSISHIFRITNLLKYALPAVTVVCVIFIITFTNKSNKDENMFKQTDNTITEIMKQSFDSTFSNKEDIKDASPEEEIAQNNNPVLQTRDNNTKQNNKSVVKTKQNGVNIEELFTESDDAEEDDVFMYESEFSNLSSKEQTDIINKLSNAKF